MAITKSDLFTGIGRLHSKLPKTSSDIALLRAITECAKKWDEIPFEGEEKMALREESRVLLLIVDTIVPVQSQRKRKAHEDLLSIGSKMTIDGFLTLKLFNERTVGTDKTSFEFDSHVYSALLQLLNLDLKMLNSLCLKDGGLGLMGLTSFMGLSKALQSNCTLVYLDLRNNSLNYNGLGWLASILKFNNTLKSLDFGVDEEFSNRNSLFFGRGSCRPFYDFEPIIEALQTNCTLTSLRVRGNSLRFEAKPLRDMLRTNSTLVSLDLGNTHGNPYFSHELINALAGALKFNNTLSTFCVDTLTPLRIRDFNTFEKLAIALENNRTLSSLNLSGIGLGPTDILCLSRALQRNRGLTSLDLSNNELTGDVEIICPLASVLKTSNTLVSLNLGRNKIGSDGCKKLAEALKANRSRTCTFLSLFDNSVRPLGFGEMEYNTVVELEIQKITEQNNISQSELRRPWGRISVLMAFMRANRENPFRNSIRELIPEITRLANFKENLSPLDLL